MIPCLLVEPPMSESDSALWTTPEERAEAASFRNERRRREFLTWRALVRRELGRHTRIAYNEIGAPVLPDGEACVAVSHCQGRVAVALSERRCTVDIEPVGRDFSRVVDRYMTPEERLLSVDPLWPGFAWCAKEALYKYAGRQALDFLEDLHLESVDLAAGQLVGRIGEGEPVELAARLSEGFLLVFAC